MTLKKSKCTLLPISCIALKKGGEIPEVETRAEDSDEPRGEVGKGAIEYRLHPTMRPFIYLFSVLMN